jgi:outer membrane murein-binding lipoprotein Lpp
MGKISLKEMIESVISDLANNEPINLYALKLQMISRNLKNETFSNWLTKEIDGYKNEDTIPAYRILTAQVKANLIIVNGFDRIQLSDHTMPLYPLGAELLKEISSIEIKDSLIALTKFLEDKDGSLAFSTTEYEREKLGHIYPNSAILSAHKPIQKSDFELIIHKFKSTLLDLFMEFNETIFEDEIDFDIMTKKKDIDKIVQQTINTGVYISENATATINGSTVIGGNENKIQISDQVKADLESIINKIEKLSQEIEADREDIAAEIYAIKVELNETIQRPKILKSALNALKGITLGVAGNEITDLIDKGLIIIRNL